MIKHILILLLVVGICSLPTSAADQDIYSYSADGTGVFSNSGNDHTITIKYTNNAGASIYADIYTSACSQWGDGTPYPHSQYYRVVTTMGTPYYMHEDVIGYNEAYRTGITIPNGNYIIGGMTANTVCPSCTSGTITMIISEAAPTEYAITGAYQCVDNVTMYIEANDMSYSPVAFNDTSPYDFAVMDGFNYSLKFSDSHEYNFTVDGSNIVYDYDACISTTYRLEESCGNLIPDSEGIYLEYSPLGWWLMEEHFYAPTGILNIIDSIATKIQVHTDTFIGRTGWMIDPVTPEATYTLENPNIAWSLKVIVMNDTDDSLIDGAMVKVDQGCYCTDGHSTRNKKTVSGMASFGDMSLQDASLLVMKPGYKICSEDTTGYNVFLSGRTNFSSKTWVVKLAPSESANVSTLYEVQNKVDIHFRDVDGNRTSQILDTDAYVDLYYENNNTDEEPMTMKFQYSSTHSHFIDALSWTITHDTIGHKRILNTNFSNPDYSYRAVIYNSSIYGWNITIPLTVRNETKEEELHYENLTTALWFRYASDGKIDYREDLEIVCHASSKNSTLLEIDIELYENAVLVEYENLTSTDFTGADFKWFYHWIPSTSYVSGRNYTVKMFGFDRTLLETAHIDCITDDITRKNKITILVKNQYGANLTGAEVYLEGWTVLSTGSTNYNTYEGIDDGTYYYSASKSEYTGTGMSSVVVSGEDELVWYTLFATTPPAINLENTTGDSWINHTWSPGAGEVTDSYNVSVNDVWHNTTTDTFYNDTYTAYAWQNITVYAYNSSGTGTLSETSVSQNTQIPQSAITNIHATTLVYNRIVWEWTNPDNYDTIMVYLDNTWMQNTTGTSYSASELAQTTAYTIKLISVYEGTERSPATDTQVTPAESGGGGGGGETPTPTPSPTPSPTPTPTPTPTPGGGGGGWEPGDDEVVPDKQFSGTCVDGVTRFEGSMVISVESPGCVNVIVDEYYLNPTTTSLIGGIRYGYAKIVVDDDPKIGGTVTFRIPDLVIDIAVYQMEDNMWTELSSTKIGNTIIVDVDRFGFFALGESGMQSVIESMTQLSLTPPKVSGILFYGWTDTYTSKHTANRELMNVSASEGIVCTISSGDYYSNRTLTCVFTPEIDELSSLKYVGEVIAIDTEGYTRRIPISIQVYNMKRLEFPLFLLIILMIGIILYRKYD